MSAGATRGDLDPGWRDAFFALLLFLLAVGVRVVAVLRTPVIFNDGPIFIALARQMGAGEWATALSHDYHPLYPLFTWWTTFLIPDWENAAIALSVVSGATAVLMLYLFVRQAYGPATAAIAGFLLAVHPYAVRFSADVQSDALYLALFLAGVACLFAALRAGSLPLAFGTGVVTGLAYLTRPEGLGVAVVGVAMAGFAWLRRSWSAGRAIGWLSCTAAGVALAVVPYVLAIRATTGAVALSRKKSVFALLGVETTALDGDAIERVPAWLIGLSAVLLLAALGLAWRRLRHVRAAAVFRARIGGRMLAVSILAAVVAAFALATDESTQLAAALVSTLRPELLLMVVIGIASRYRSGPHGRALFVSSFVGLYTLVLLGLLLHYGYVSRRHALPPLTLLLGYAAVGVVVVGEALSRLPSRLRGRSLGERLPAWPARVWCAALALLLATIALPKSLADHRSEQLASRLAAEWLREHPAPPGRVAGSKAKVGYYAGREWRPLWGGGAPRSLGQLERDGVRWVIAEENALDGRLSPVGRLGATAEWALEERYRVQAKGRHAVVFELVAR